MKYLKSILISLGLVYLYTFLALLFRSEIVVGLVLTFYAYENRQELKTFFKETLQNSSAQKILRFFRDFAFTNFWLKPA